MKKRNKHIGSSLDDFLKEEGVLEETRAVVLKETLAWQVQQAMKKDKISKVEMARRMKTSRAALDRLLDPWQCLGDVANVIARGTALSAVICASSWFEKLTSPGRRGPGSASRVAPQVRQRKSCRAKPDLSAGG
jgi:antitoxin HicB